MVWRGPMLFMAVMGGIEGFNTAMQYLDGRNFTEPVVCVCHHGGGRQQAGVAGVVGCGAGTGAHIPRPPLAFFSPCWASCPLLGLFITGASGHDAGRLADERHHFASLAPPAIRCLGCL